MKQQPTHHVVDELARLAAHAEPPMLDDAGSHRMIEAAATAPAPRRGAPAKRSLAWPLAAAAFACLAVVAWQRPRHADPALTQQTLPTGDRLAGTAGARFQIVELVPASRRLHLDSGSVVFDVAHVTAGQHFEVSTTEATVIATGTVFSVAADHGTTHVHVFEGSVTIGHDGRRDPLFAGASWSSAGADDANDRITAAGEAFAREREQAAIAAPKPEPVAVATTATEPVAAAVVRPATTPRAPAVSSLARPADPPPDRTVSAISVEAARADVSAGRYTDALDKASATLRTGESGAWDLVRGDALRALGRTAEAADAFEVAARELSSTARLDAAYSAAYLRFHDLGDGERALADLMGTDEPGTMFEERALVLRVKILVSLKRTSEASVFAARYLDRFPRGSSAKLVRAIAARGGISVQPPVSP